MNPILSLVLRDPVTRAVFVVGRPDAAAVAAAIHDSSKAGELIAAAEHADWAARLLRAAEHSPLAARFGESEPVSFCHAGAETESPRPERVVPIVREFPGSDLAARQGMTRTCGMLLLRLVVIASAATRAEAQALGYAVAGPAGISGFFSSSASSVHAVGGAEVLSGGRVGVAGEMGVFANSSSALLTASANGVVHVASAPLSPFVTGGYTRMGNGEGGFNAWNVGVGADYWARSRVGLRVDFRDHVRPDSRGTVHYWTIRGGVVFR